MPEKFLRLGMTECSLLFIYWMNYHKNIENAELTCSKNNLIKWLYTTSGYYDKIQSGNYFNVIHNKDDTDIYKRYMSILFEFIKYSDIYQFCFHNFTLKSEIEEFEQITNQLIYVSATPADYELQKSEGVVVEQLIRPTGLLDPIIEVRPSLNQIDNLIEEIQNRIKLNERTLVTTLTKRMAEELQKYLDKIGVPCRYIHSDIDTIERVEILRDLRLGNFDVLIGVNLLREGLDLPEVSLVAIIDADKEGFLRDVRSLVQTVGRAARNVNGFVIMYADKITQSMQKTIDETARRRNLQMNYNQENGIIPRGLSKTKEQILESTTVALSNNYKVPEEKNIPQAAEKESEYGKINSEDLIKKLKKEMEAAAKNLDFIEAARIRDEIKKIEASK